MALHLSIIKSPPGVTLAATQKAFSEQGGTIGRGDGNDWVLSDPDRFLSSRHCGLSCEGGQYYLTDMSTNGTFINGAPEPLGKGGKIPLNDGDTIEVGDYQFRAELQPDVALPDDPFGVTQAPVGAIQDPFSPPASGSEPDPFAAPPQPPVSDPFGVDPFASAEALPLNADPHEVDPLAALDKASSPLSGGAGLADAPIGAGADDPFAAKSLPIEEGFAASRQTHSDGAGALDQAVHWPAAESENLIPEDWDDDMLTASTAPSPHKPVSRPPPVAPQDDLNLSGAHRSMPLTDPPQSREAHPRKPREPLLAERKPDAVKPFQPAVAKEREQTPAPTPKPARRAAAPPAAGDALLNALGLAEKNFSGDDIAELQATLGELIPVIITGMMQVLRSRASIKNEFRMNVTTIQPIENNPLKFSADAGEAIDNMFVRKSSAYMQAKEAFQEGFDGIGEHQVAIIAGIRAAFKSMMDRFNPELLERQFDKQNKGMVLPGMQKTKYWNSYIDYYNGFVDNMENTFQYLFGDEFVQAYEDQLRRLAVERKQRQKSDQ